MVTNIMESNASQKICITEMEIFVMHIRKVGMKH